MIGHRSRVIGGSRQPRPAPLPLGRSPQFAVRRTSVSRWGSDGTGRAATVTTNPVGLETTVTYNGNTALPINASTYAVVATITDLKFAVAQWREKPFQPHVIARSRPVTTGDGSRRSRRRPSRRRRGRRRRFRAENVQLLHRLLDQLERWRKEAARAGRTITRTVVAYESGRDGFWLARLLQNHGIEVYVIHASSVAVSREQRRAKTDRLDTEMLMRALLGWLRGEPGHCRMVAIPTVEQEDARRPGREREALVGERTRLTNTIKAELALWGIQGFKPGLKKAAEHLEALRTVEGEPLPPNTLAKLHRLLERRRLIGEQIKVIEQNAAQAAACCTDA